MVHPASHSMQPPDTDSARRAVSFTARWLPTGRGDEPNVRTTVTSATAIPNSCQARMGPKISSSVKVSEVNRLSI